MSDTPRPWRRPADRIVVREAARVRRYHVKWLGRLLRPAPVREVEAPGGGRGHTLVTRWSLDRRTGLHPVSMAM